MNTKINTKIKCLIQLASNSSVQVLHPPIVSLPTQTVISDVSATVGATLDCSGLETVWSIEYGATIAYGATHAGGTTSANGAKTVGLIGLSPETLLHWRFKAVNSDGTTYSSDQTLTTTATPAILVQNLFKPSQIISQDLGTKAIDYSSSPVNADIYQNCLYPTGDIQATFDSTINIDWQTDGVKCEFIASLKSGSTASYVCYHNTNASWGIFLQTTGFKIGGYKADGTTITSITFPAITTAADDVLYRYRVTKTGTSIKIDKTSPSDTTFASATSSTLDVSSKAFYIDTYKGVRSAGRLCYLNLMGYKFAFGEGAGARTCFSFNSSKRIVLPATTHMSGLQNAYCHNAIYGYSRAYIEHSSTIKESVNISYNDDSTSATSYHTAFLTRYQFVEFPASKSFGMGYGIKLNASLETYDQANTFFDASHVAKLINKGNIPSKLNSRISYDHVNNEELRVSSNNDNVTRTLNTAAKNCLIVGDSMASDAYFWGQLLCNLSGLVKTVRSFSGKNISNEIQALLEAQVAITPTLISSQDFIIMEGGFNDWTQNISEATYTSGIAALYAYIRSQNATAPIWIIGIYNWGNPIDDGTTSNTSGLTRNRIRELMSALADANANSVYFNWNTANIVLADVDPLHTTSIIGGYKLAKMMYDKILTL